MSSLFARPLGAAVILGLALLNGCLTATATDGALGPALSLISIIIWFGSEWVAA